MPSRPKRKQHPAGQSASDTEDFSGSFSVPTPNFCKVGDLLKITGQDILGLARVTKGEEIRPYIELCKLRQPRVHEGKMCNWVILLWNRDAAGNRLGVIQTALLTVQTEEEARAICERQVQQMRARYQAALAQYESSSVVRAIAEPVVKAQWEVLKEVWPETVKAILDGSDPSKAYNAETLARTGKGAFAIEPEDAAETFAILEKAYSRKLTFDPVNVELVTGWIGAGYRDMKPREYTEKINAKLGTAVTEVAMKGRAITKLGLVSRRSEGRPANDGELPPG